MSNDVYQAVALSSPEIYYLLMWCERLIWAPTIAHKATTYGVVAHGGRDKLILPDARTFL